MSLESWKKEFYPVPAWKVAKRKALAHSLRKWEGLTKKNLKKHGVWIDLTHRRIVDQYDENLRIDDITCALCEHHSGPPNCPTCPLSVLRGGQPCDEGKGSPYRNFLHGDPLPMLRLLRKAKKAEDGGK